ncbi:MAG: hypothetical protein DMG02_00380 [Acidobacteria bacterium]|nr:MAG: hypothetical protein DMG02_00380 [Acidobacteriota bacterium]
MCTEQTIEVQMQNAAEFIMCSLRASGVDVVFGYPGQSNLRLLRAAARAGVRYVQMADERGAGFAASGYIEATGRPAVVCVSKGPGTTNLLTPLAAATVDGVPLVAIAVGVSAERRNQNAFQDFNACEAFAVGRAVKAARNCYAPAHLPALVTELLIVSWTPPRGAVLLDIAESVLEDAIEAAPVAVSMRESHPATLSPAATLSASQAVAALRSALRPVLVVGSGARDDYLRIRAFSARRSIPTVHTIGGTGIIATGERHYGGLLRHNGSREAAYLTAKADAIVALGTGLDERATGEPSQFAVNALKVHVDVNPEVLQRCDHVTNVRVPGSVAAFVDLVDGALASDINYEEWLHEFEAKRGDWSVQHTCHGQIRAGELVRAIADVLCDSIVVKDSGAHKYWVTNLAPCNAPQNSIASCHFGAMGFAIPAAIGASVGRPHDRVVVTCGDGGALMALSDLVTAMREGCHNIKVIVFNNAGLASTRDYEWTLGDVTISSFSQPLALASFAAGLGVGSMTVSNRDELRVLCDVLKADGLMLVDCLLDPSESLNPVVSWRRALAALVETDIAR